MKKSIGKFLSLALVGAMVMQPIPAFQNNVDAGISGDAQFAIEGANVDGRVGANMPYTRYDSLQATLGGSASIASSPTYDRMSVATQASEQSYVKLPSNGASAQWTMKTTGRGVTVRFTMPDSSDGMGLKGSLDVYVNGNYKKTVDLTSYYMWQYFAGGNPSDTNDGGPGAFAFDEVHFLLDESLKAGDTIKIQSTGKNNLEYGVDFLEIEDVAAPITQPDNSLNVEDYGAYPDDGVDDYNAIYNCIAAADSMGMDVYIPEGKFEIGQMWRLYGSDIKITGAGMWYTNIQFTSSKAGSGGISGGYGQSGNPKDGYCKNVEFCNMYINSNLRSRYNQEAVYKCFMDVFADGSVIHDVWEEHFECGFWIADYNGKIDYSDNLTIMNCRIRNNLADGVNFCNGTSNSTVYNNSIRNNGDDGFAIWNNTFMGSKDESNNTCCYNTIDFIWRAGAIALYGGNNIKVYNNYLCDTFMAAGIHINTNFDGHKFTNTTNIQFDNNIMVRCGSTKDSWGEELGAVDIHGEAKNITFNNTKIYDAQHDGVTFKSGPSAITFNNTKVFGCGVDGQKASYSSVAHNGAAIMTIGGPSATFNGFESANVAYTGTGAPYFFSSGQGGIVINNDVYHGNDTQYTVPSYPAADSSSVNPGGEIINPLEGIKGYDLKVAALSWANENGSTDIKDGEQVTFTAVIKNDSNVNIPEGVVIGLKTVVDGSSSFKNETYKNGLKAGATVKISTTGKWIATRGGHTIVATADDANKLSDELDENNNTRTKSFNVSGESATNTITRVNGGYDLVVSKIATNSESIAAGDNVRFTATITNAGDTAVPAGTVIGYQIQIDENTSNILWCDTYSNGLAAGASVDLQVNSGSSSQNYWKATTGKHSIMAWVDDVNRFANEVNETNNKFSISLSIPTATMILNPDNPDDLENIGQEVTTNPVETTKPAETTEQEAVTINSDKVKIEGYQMSAKFGGVEGSMGLRTVYTVEPEINGKEVQKAGVICGVEYGQNPVTSNDILLNSENSFVAEYEATSKGLIGDVIGDSSTAKKYARTFNIDNFNADGLTAKYYIRAYAVLSDGTIAYGEVKSFKMYEVAKYIYQNKTMVNETAHNYLYTKVLMVVDANELKVDYNWSKVVVKLEDIKYK